MTASRSVSGAALRITPARRAGSEATQARSSAVTATCFRNWILPALPQVLASALPAGSTRASRHSSANKLKGCQRPGAAQVKYGCVIGGYQQVAYPQYGRIRVISLSGGPQAERLVRGRENSKYEQGLTSGSATH